MSILNLGLANLGLSMEPEALEWPFDMLRNNNSMKAVHEALDLLCMILNCRRQSLQESVVRHASKLGRIRSRKRHWKLMIMVYIQLDMRLQYLQVV